MPAGINSENYNSDNHAPFSVQDMMELPWILARSLNQFWNPHKGQYEMADIPFDAKKVKKFRLLVDRRHQNLGMVVRYWIEGWLELPTVVELLDDTHEKQAEGDESECILFLVNPDEHNGLGNPLRQATQGKMPTIQAVSRSRMGWSDKDNGILYLLTGPAVKSPEPLEFMGRMAVLACFVFELACRQRPMDRGIVVRMTVALRNLPLLVASVLELDGQVSAATRDILATNQSIALLGWGPSRAVNLDVEQQLSALGLTIHVIGQAESISSIPVLCLAPDDAWYDIAMESLRTLMTTSQKLLLLSGRPETMEFPGAEQTSINLPPADLIVQTIISTVIMQLLVCHIRTLPARE